MCDRFFHIQNIFWRIVLFSIISRSIVFIIELRSPQQFTNRNKLPILLSEEVLEGKGL